MFASWHGRVRADVAVAHYWEVESMKLWDLVRFPSSLGARGSARLTVAGVAVVLALAPSCAAERDEDAHKVSDVRASTVTGATKR